MGGYIKRGGWVHQASVTLPHFIECLYQAMKVERPCIGIFGYIPPVPLCFYDFSIRFWNCSDNGVIFVFHFIMFACSAWLIFRVLHLFDFTGFRVVQSSVFCSLFYELSYMLFYDSRFLVTSLSCPTFFL